MAAPPDRPKILPMDADTVEDEIRTFAALVEALCPHAPPGELLFEVFEEQLADRRAALDESRSTVRVLH